VRILPRGASEEPEWGFFGSTEAVCSVWSGKERSDGPITTRLPIPCQTVVTN
jgi:hypothetical protein